MKKMYQCLFILLIIFGTTSLISVSLFITEVVRVYGVQRHVTTELKRACNYAVIEAVYDDYRIDKRNILDQDVARAAFYQYLFSDLGLTESLEKYEDGELKYRLILSDLTISSENVQCKVTGSAAVPATYFSGFSDFEIPFKVSSVNMRIDGL